MMSHSASREATATSQGLTKSRSRLRDRDAGLSLVGGGRPEPATLALALAAAFLLVAVASAQDSLAEGRKLFGRGEYAKAQAALRAAQVERPDDADVLFWLGRAAFETGDFAAAADVLAEAAHARPKSADHQYWLGVALERAARLGEALTAYRQALTLDRGHRPAAEAIARLTPPKPMTERFAHHAVALELSLIHI